MQNILPKIRLTYWDILAIILCSIPAFYLLGKPSIYIWDEAVYANASLEMARGSSLILPVNETYNSKPPLVLWLQAASLHIFNDPEFAIRFPSAISVTGLLFIMVMALGRWGFSQLTRLLVAVCFVGNEGFIRHHIARTGDLDAVMAFFVTCYLLVALDALHFKKWTSKHVVYFFIAAICAFYAKSIGGWLMMGPFLLLVLLSNSRKILISKKFILGAVLTFAICAFYYLWRETIQPGFSKISFSSDYLRMFKNVMPWHEHPFSYYFKNFVVMKTYVPWIYILVIAILYGLFFMKDKLFKNDLGKWVFLSFGYLLIISIPAVKLEWYDAPVFPLFAIILGAVMGYVIKNFSAVLKYLLLIPVSFILWRKINFIEQDVQPRHPFEFEGSILSQSAITTNTKVYMPVETPEHRLQLDFYRKIFSKEKKIMLPVLDSIDQISIGDQLIVRNEFYEKEIQPAFITDTLEVFTGRGISVIIEEKK